jgi:hypothetical protein
MATEECNSQAAPIEEYGENKKRKEKRAKPPGTEVKPIRKVTLSLSDGGKLRRLLTAHEAKCGESLTASNLFTFVINRMAVQILDALPKKSLKCGASRPPLRGAKRSLWLEDGVRFELENEEPRVVCGLLTGLCSNALMECVMANCLVG